MIRMVLLGLGFLAVTVALVVLQPGAGPRTEDQPLLGTSPVTRGEPALTMPLTDEPHVAEPTQPVQATPLFTAPQPAPTATAAAPADMDDQSIRRMTWDTLSNLNQATGRESAPGQPGSLLHTIVRRSLDDQGAAPGVGGSAQSARNGVYVVQPGDSLVSIAQSIYGDVNMTGPLFAANQELLKGPDSLQPGQSLVLPQF